MELFTKLFGNLLIFVYHCFDRIVIHGYLSGLSRPEQVVHFFRRIVGVAANWDASLGLVVDIAPSFREKLGHRATDFLACIVESGWSTPTNSRSSCPVNPSNIPAMQSCAS